MMAAPVRAATARLAPVKLQNQRSSEPSPDLGGACSLKIECKKCATRLAPLFLRSLSKLTRCHSFTFDSSARLPPPLTTAQLTGRMLSPLGSHLCLHRLPIQTRPKIRVCRSRCHPV